MLVINRPIQLNFSVYHGTYEVLEEATRAGKLKIPEFEEKTSTEEEETKEIEANFKFLITDRRETFYSNKTQH